MTQSILKLENITKVYSNGVVANHDINIELNEGEIHAIVGENGAGKSTLMKIIFGIEHATSGNIYYQGKKINFTSSMDAIEAGIGMVHQHFMLIPSFTIAESIVLGDEPKNGIYLDKKKAVEVTSELAKKYNFEMDVTRRIADLTVSEKQKVEILKTLYRDAKLIILDEPTAVLTPQETDQLFEQLKQFKKMGHTIVFISHKLNEVKEISDRITVIRLGETFGTYNNEDVSIEKLTELIIGKKLDQNYAALKTPVENAAVLFDVDNINYTVAGVKKLDDVSFSIKAGEILGVAGVQGNGQEELIKDLTGMIAHQSGSVKIGGKNVENANIKTRRDAGLSYVPEDRMEDGVALPESIGDNIVSTFYQRPEYSSKFFIKSKAIAKEATHLIEKFSIKATSYKDKVGALSGGNIQKVVVAREWETQPSVLIAEQPTRGIDIGSADYIHHQLIDMRNQGKAILLVSADLSEVMSLSDRLIVMYEGKIVAYFDSVDQLSESELGLYMLGASKQDESIIRGAKYE